MHFSSAFHLLYNFSNTRCAWAIHYAGAYLNWAWIRSIREPLHSIFHCNNIIHTLYCSCCGSTHAISPSPFLQNKHGCCQHTPCRDFGSMTGKPQEKAAFRLSLASCVDGIREGWRRMRGEGARKLPDNKVSFCILCIPIAFLNACILRNRYSVILTGTC